MYVDVLCEIGAKAVDNVFVYRVPKELEDNIKIGIRVSIPFGKMSLEGFVINIKSSTNYDESKIKDITSIIDNVPVLNEEMLELGKYMSDNLLCSKVSAYQVMLPKALKAKAGTNIKIKYNRYLKRTKSIEEIDNYIKNCKYEGQINLLCKLKEGDILVSKMSSTINTIIKHGLGEIVNVEEKRYNYTGLANYKKIVLSKEQESVKDKIVSSFGKSETFLLYGVTGSGKTEVYMSVIEEALKEGKEAIMLVPEISLTPQIVGKFISRFGEIISVLHSRLSDNERYDEYRKITEGKSKIVIGTRSAIFAPFNNLGVVLSESVLSSIKSILSVGGFVVLFSVIISILNKTRILVNISYAISSLFHINSAIVEAFLTGLIEFTNGLNNISNVDCGNIAVNIILSSFILGFGGISVTLQSISIISSKKLSSKFYILGKISQAFIASIYTFIVLKFVTL